MSAVTLPPPPPAVCLTRSYASRKIKGGTIIAEDVRDLEAHRRMLLDPDEYRAAIGACWACGSKVLHALCFRERILREAVVRLEHWLEKTDVLRPVPPSVSLDQVFLHRARRVVRKDGTVRFRGGFLEVRSSLVGKEVELRFDPFLETALPRVFLDGKFVCDTVPFDPISNSARRRHRPSSPAKEAFPSSGIDPLALIQREHLRRARPPAGFSLPDDDNDDEMEIHAHV